MKPIIEISHLSKKYRLGQQESYYALRDTIARFFRNPLTTMQTHTSSNEFWALKDLNLKINQGEVVGVIGKNGAGKSTLLKVLSQITPPTEGEVILRGRVGSLLEVGTGFNPELTGRENIFLNGAILGMKKAEVKRKFDEIVDFAQIEKFLDTPTKYYSSGMYMRLAFAVAAHLEPEILIVDEVLAVGDAEFQKKCLGKMNSVANEGRTVLFVSHNMTALKSLCHKAVLLESGRIVKKGDVETVANFYLNKNISQTTRVWKDRETAPGNENVRLKYAKISSSKKDDRDIYVDTPFKLEFAFWNNLENARLNFSMVISNTDGLVVFNSISEAEKYGKGLVTGTCFVPGGLLNDEKYRVMVMITKDRSTPLFYMEDVLLFEVKDVPRLEGWQGKWPGVIRPQLKWKTSITT